jgi:hypothetical protein
MLLSFLLLLLLVHFIEVNTAYESLQGEQDASKSFRNTGINYFMLLHMHALSDATITKC